MTLQSAFYVIGIIFMSVMLILIVALVAAVFVIRSKVMSIHDRIEQSLRLKNDVAEVGKKIFSTAKSVARKHN